MITKLFSIFSSILVTACAVFLFSGSASAATCNPTGFYRDGINMTAASINPTSLVNGSIDATGCNVGVYFGPGHNGNINNETISGSNYYGVVVQKANVNITNSNIHNIGENPLNGDQHGVGIYYATITGVTNGDCSSGSTSGSVVNNTVSVYQKGGIVVNCTGSNVSVTGNKVIGQGPVDYIAQNGIQFGYGAKGSVTQNTVSGNAYSGANEASSGGILVVGGPCYGGDYTNGLTISQNTLTGNDVGVYISNLNGSCDAPTDDKTNITVVQNKISNNGLTNTTGDGPTQGYQAGVSDQGNGDSIIQNTITGKGYDPANSSSSIFTAWIDTSGTNNAKLIQNSTH